MKKFHKNILIILIIFTVSSLEIMAQGEPPPPPGGHGQSDNQAAPIGGGLFILLGLGAAYGGKKIYDMQKESLGE